MERSKRAAATTASKRISEIDDEDYTPVKRKYNKKSTLKKEKPKIQVVEEIPIEFDFGGNEDLEEQQFDNDDCDDEGGIPPECFLEVNIQEQDNEAQLQQFNYQFQQSKSFGEDDWDPLSNSLNLNHRQEEVSNRPLKPIINRFPCGFCDTVFTDPSFLIRHHKRCKSKRAAECSPARLIQDQSIIARPPPPQPSAPPQNSESNELLEMYGFHREIVKGKRMFCCNQCTFTTRNADHLKYHKPIHSDEKVVKCDKCTFACRDANQMKAHKDTHLFSNPVNNNDNANANTMDMLAVQSVSKLYSCDQCNYTSTRPGYLVMHKRIHNRDQPFVCADCGYKCARLSYFNKHRVTHHGDQQEFEQIGSDES